MAQERERAIQEQTASLEAWREQSESPIANRRRRLSDILLYGSLGVSAISSGLFLYNFARGVEATVKHTGQAPERFLFAAVGLTIASAIGVIGPMVSQRIGQPTKGELTALQRFIQLAEQPLPPTEPPSDPVGPGGVSPIVPPPFNLSELALATTH